MAEKVVSAINRALLPQLQELKGELKAINSRLDSYDTKIEDFRNEFRSELKRIDDTSDTNFKRLEEKMDSNFKRLDEKINELSIQLETQRKLSVLEAKVAESRTNETLNSNQTWFRSKCCLVHTEISRR